MATKIPLSPDLSFQQYPIESRTRYCEYKQQSFRCVCFCMRVRQSEMDGWRDSEKSKTEAEKKSHEGSRCITFILLYPAEFISLFSTIIIIPTYYYYCGCCCWCRVEREKERSVVCGFVLDDPFTVLHHHRQHNTAQSFKLLRGHRPAPFFF